MELQKGSWIMYEAYISDVINLNIPKIKLKIETISKINGDIIITESGDKLCIQQIIRDSKTMESNPLYVSNYLLKKKNNLMKKMIHSKK